MTAEEFVLFDKIITRESNWNPLAQNPNSTAFGTGQFLNSTWAYVGCEKTADPYTQIDCTRAYILKRYGSYENAWDFWTENKFY